MLIPMSSPEPPRQFQPPPANPPPADLPSQVPLPSGGPIAITGPLSIGDLLDRTFRALRARFGVLMLSAAIVMVPLGIVTTLISGRFLTGYFDLLQFSLNTPSSEFPAEQALGEMGGYVGAILLLSVLSTLGSSLVSLMTMHHIQHFLHGEDSTVAEGWRVALRRILPLIGMHILEFLVIGFVTAALALIVGMVIFILVLIFGGALAVLGNDSSSVLLAIGFIVVFLIGYLVLLVLLLAPTVFFMGRWIAAAPSLLIEKLGPVHALQRSWALTKGRMWRGILYIVLLTVLSMVVIGLPLGILQTAAMLLAPSQLVLIGLISTAAGYVLNLVYQPFYATGTVLFYYDLRVRAEAYDVALRVAALEAEVAPDAAAL